MVIPSGCRNSEPTPLPIISGSAPSSGRQGRHQDRAKAQQAGLVDGFARTLAFLAFSVERKVDHHDGVLFDDADQQDDADDAMMPRSVCESISASSAPTAGRGQRGQNRDRWI